MTTLDAMWDAVAQRPGATALDLSSVERELGLRLPDDLKQVLLRSDGLEGLATPDAYLALWSCNQIPSLNRGYGVAELIPGVTLIGTDGGNTGYGFIWKGAVASYVDVPLVGMDPREIVIVGDSFAEFIDRLGKEYRR